MDQYEEAFLPDDNDPLDVVPKKRNLQQKRLARAKKAFIRTPVAWARDEILFNSCTRLWFLLERVSQEGRYDGEIPVTTKFAALANVSRRTKNRCVLRIEAAGKIEVDWSDQAAPRVRVKPLPL
jgi:hypothetical protein